MQARSSPAFRTAAAVAAREDRESRTAIGPATLGTPRGWLRGRTRGSRRRDGAREQEHGIRGDARQPPRTTARAHPDPDFDFLTFEEADRLIAGPRDEWRVMIFLALRTGMRRGELLGLRWEDVDLSVGRINVRQSYVREEFGTPKSGKPRLIPLGDDVIEALRFQRHDRGPLVFCDYHGKPLTPSLLMSPLTRALKRAGLRSVGWHVLRHTFASHLVMRGVALKVVQELLGHSSIETTMIYAHLMPEIVRDAVRTLDGC